MGSPARNYSWPPFEEGNTAALHHGARSERKVSAHAAMLGDELIEARPDLAGERYAAWRRRYLYADAIADLYNQYVLAKANQAGIESVPEWAEKRRIAANNLANATAAEGCITPASEARLVRDVSAAGLNAAHIHEARYEALMARGAEANAAGEALLAAAGAVGTSVPPDKAITGDDTEENE